MPRMTKNTAHTLLVFMKNSDAAVETNDQLDDPTKRLDQRTHERLHRPEQTRQELSERLDRLDRRQVEAEIRLATGLTAVVGAVHMVRDAVLADRGLKRTVDDHELRLAAIERRTG